MHNIINKSRAARTIKNGFTLIEILIVVLIIGILAAIALPQYNISVERTKMAEAATIIKQIAEANKRYYMATGAYSPDDMRTLDITIAGTAIGGRVETNFFRYAAFSGNPTIANAFRLPVIGNGEGVYRLYIIGTSNKVTCMIKDTANDIQRKLCAQINAEGTI